MEQLLAVINTLWPIAVGFTALVFWLAASMLNDFVVLSFGAALVGSLLYTGLNMVINSALERLLPR